MSVYQGKNGKWYCSFQINGERKHLLCHGATTRKEAEQFETSKKFNLIQQQSGAIPLETPNITLSQLLHMEVKYARLNKKSYKTDECRIKPIKTFFGANTYIKDIKPEKIEAFKTYLLQAGRSRTTVNRYLEQLSKCFSIAVENEYLKKNPCKSVKKFPIKNTTIRYLNKEEEYRLMKKLPEYLKPIFITALNTGLRKSNILQLMWEQVNFELKHIEILENKGNKHLIIPLNKKMLELLRELHYEGAKGHIFVNPKTGTYYKDIKKAWHSALKEAGIENFRFHDLRHTVGTRMAVNNVPIHIIKTVLGHSEIKTTMRYLHSTSQSLLSAVEVL